MAGDKYQFFIITLWPEESEIGVECTHCKGGGGRKGAFRITITFEASVSSVLVCYGKYFAICLMSDPLSNPYMYIPPSSPLEIEAHTPALTPVCRVQVRLIMFLVAKATLKLKES